MIEKQLKAEFEKIKTAIDQSDTLYMVKEDPVIDCEYGMVIFTIQKHGIWTYIGNLWIDNCAHCGHQSILYELYDPNQSEESDPDPLIETQHLDMLINFLKA